LSLDKHITALSAKCFFQLRQLRRIRRSLDDDSVATLVHALSSAVLTTVSGYWRVLLRRRLTSYSVSSTLLHGLYQTVGSTTGVWPSFVFRPSTGWTSPTASSLDCACWYTIASTAWLPHT